LRKQEATAAEVARTAAAEAHKLEVQALEFARAADHKVLTDLLQKQEDTRAQELALQKKLNDEKKSFSYQLQESMRKIKNLLPTSPELVDQIPQWIQQCDQMFDIHEIPENCRASVFMSLLNETARKAIYSLPPDLAGDYQACRKAVLEEYRLSAH